MNETENQILPLVAETLVVEKRPVVTSSVKIRTETDIVQEIADVDLMKDVVDVQRVTVNREVEQVPAVRRDGDVTIVPVVEEMFVVVKRLVLKEEIHITRRVTHERVEVPVTLRKQRAVIERSDPADQPSTEEEAIHEHDQ